MSEVFVGSKLLKITDTDIIIERDGIVYTIEYDIDQGACCSYADVFAKLLVSETESPVITSITYKKDNSNYRVCRCVLTFFGVNRAIADACCQAGSESGYDYGANVQLVCKELRIKEVLIEQ